MARFHRFNNILIVLLLSLTSCASYFQNPNLSRSIAEEISLPINFEDLMTIKTSHKKSEMNVLEAISAIQGPHSSIEFIEDPKMSNDIAFKIVPEVSVNRYHFKIFHSINGKTDSIAAEELSQIFLKFSELFESDFSAFELLYNAQKGDFQALYALSKIRELSLKVTEVDFEDDYFDAAKERLPYWESINQKLNVLEAAHHKKVRKLKEERKPVMDILDKLSEDKQLKALIAKNDRKGSAELIRKYLPWEEMPPFEKHFWETHLNIMVDPLPLEDRVIIYRGIDNDMIYAPETVGKILSHDEALKDQEIFLMSTILTKNQGTWNRRLRSLTTMYEKHIDTNIKNSSEFTKAARISTMFARHARNPQGSPFLSYTPKFLTAKSFGKKRNSAFFIDPRMLYFNYASRFEGEIEFLLPLMTFPDEVAAVYDVEIHNKNGNLTGHEQDFFKSKSIEKLNAKLGADKGAKVYEQIESNSKKFFASVMNEYQNLIGKKNSPNGNLASVFKNIHGANAKKAAEALKSKTDMSCIDLIQIFWK